jgi:hypothetical protein
MQGFLYSCLPGAGQGRAPLHPGPAVVAYEPLASGQLMFSCPLGAGPSCPPESFRVVLFYEDLATGNRARSVWRRLTAETGEGGGLDQGRWRSAALHGPRLQADIAEADLLILSVQCALPAGTGALLGAWLEAKGDRDSALVALVDGGVGRPKAAGSASARLARLARRHGLCCVQERFEVPDGPGQGRWEAVWVF